MSNMNNKYKNSKNQAKLGMRVDMLFTFIMLVGGINYFFLAYKSDMFNPFGKWKTIVYLIIALATLYKIRLVTFLPFLGETAFPSGVLEKKVPKDANVEFNLQQLPPNTYVVYWGSDAEGDPTEAYGEYTNSGVTTTDDNGNVKLLLKCPTRYYVGRKKLPKHVHYRYALSNGLLSKVHTKTIEC